MRHLCSGWLLLLLFAQLGNVHAAPCQVSGHDQLHLLDCAGKLDAAAAATARALLAPSSARKGQWFRADLVAKHDELRLLDVGIPDAWYIQVFLVQDGRVHKVLDLDEASRYADRPAPHRSLLAPLHLPAGASTVYVFFHSHNETPLFLRLLTQQQLIASDTFLNLSNGIIFGIMLVLIAALIVGFSAQQLVSLRLYGIMILTNLIFIVQIEGYPFAYLWPNSPTWNMLAPGTLALCTAMAHCAFAISFLRMKTSMPRLYRMHMLMFCVAFGTFVLHLAFGDDLALSALMALYPLLACVSALQALRQGMPAARFYFFGALSLLFLTGVMVAYIVLQVNPFPAFPMLAMPKLGYLYEAILFGTAVLSQVRQSNLHQSELRKQRLSETEQLLRAERDKLSALQKASEHQLRLASVSHDIAQPLASLRFAITAFAQQQAAAPITDHMNNTLQYAQSLLKDLIEKVQEEQLLPEQVVLNTTFQQLRQAFHDTASHKGLRLSVHTSSLRFDGSSLLLYRILTNLLANAVRYTAKGRIILGARRRAHGIDIMLHDTGPGIASNLEQLLLQPFRQGVHGEGYGLGLFIVKNLCHQCNYQLRIRSVQGKGSCFTIFIPHAAPR